MTPQIPEWLAGQIPFRHSMHTVDGHQLHLMEHGKPDGFPVLMVHGNPTWGFLWRKVALQLAEKDVSLRLLMPDLLGLGLSEKPRDPKVHTLERHAALLGRWIDQLGLEKLLLVVQDWGGPIGVLANERNFARVKGLVVLNTVLGPPREGFRPTAFHRFAQTRGLSDVAFRVFGFPQRNLGAAQGDKRSMDGDVGRAYKWVLRNRFTNVAPLALARMVPHSQAHESIPALQRVAQLARNFTGPAEIVWGERDPVLGRALKRVQEVLPRANTTLTRAGHFLQEEVPVEIADAVLRVRC